MITVKFDYYSYCLFILLLALCCWGRIPEEIHLKRGKVYLASYFQWFLCMVSCLYYLGLIVEYIFELESKMCPHKLRIECLVPRLWCCGDPRR